MAEVCADLGVRFVARTPTQWALDARHFFGAGAAPQNKLDWWHLNYIGARSFSEQLAQLVESETN
jgi:hypothetical protein